MKVLVTGAGALLGQGILRSLRESSLDLHVIAADPSELSAGLYWGGKGYLIPLAKDPSYMDCIRALLARERPDAVLLGTDVELALFAEAREELERTFATHVVVSSPAVVAIADDKYLTFEFMRDNGFDAPDSALPEGNGVEALIGRVGFPLIVKPRVGARSVGVARVTNREELARALTFDAGPGPGLVVQECVSTADDEYTAGVVCFDGRCEASIVMRRDLRDGNTYRAYVDVYPELNAAVRKMAERLAPYGPANFQFRVADGRVKVFEINARFSGTTPLRMRAGFNEVEMVLRRVVKGEPVTQPAVERLTILRHWSETVVRPGDAVERA